MPVMPENPFNAPPGTVEDQLPAHRPIALPLNFAMGNVLAGRVNALLFILPVILLVAAFGALMLLDNWLHHLLGVPLDGDLGAHPVGGIAQLAVSVVFVFLAMGGYLLGWTLNALIARYCLQWPSDRVVAIFMRSEVPQDWIKPGQPSPDELELLDNEFCAWSDARRVGKLRYIARDGLFKLGLVFYSIFQFGAWFRGDPVLSRKTWIELLVFSLLLGTAMVTMVWYWREHRYQHQALLRRTAP